MTSLPWYEKGQNDPGVFSFSVIVLFLMTLEEESHLLIEIKQSFKGETIIDETAIKNKTIMRKYSKVKTQGLIKKQIRRFSMDKQESTEKMGS